MWNYVSRPDLKPAALTVDKLPTKAAAPGDMFLAPQAGPVRNGTEMLGPYGGLLWFYPAPKGQYVTDFREQTYQGKPVLTWWQGTSTMSGVGHGVDGSTTSPTSRSRRSRRPMGWTPICTSSCSRPRAPPGSRPTSR